MSTDTEEDVWEKKHVEFEGDVECPFDHCDASGSDLWTIDHFVHGHARVDKRHRLAQFIRTDEYKQWGPDVEYWESKRGPNWLAKRTIDEQVTDAVEAHPVLQADMYEAYFGSISEAVTQCLQGTHPDYDSYTEYSKRREFIEMEDRLTGRTHKEYGSDWGDIAWEIYMRDNLECRVCHDDPSPGSGLDVHHITPARKFDDQSEMNDPSNLITLCASCHGKHEGDFQGCDPDEFVRRARAAQPVSQ